MVVEQDGSWLAKLQVHGHDSSTQPEVGAKGTQICPLRLVLFLHSLPCKHGCGCREPDWEPGLR